MSKHKRIHGNTQQGGQSVQVVRQQFRSAPLPTPQELAHYDQVGPGLAATLVQMAQDNQKDRLSTNKTMRVAMIMGQLFAFFVAIGALGAGAYLAYKGQNVAGIATIVTSLAVPLTAFIYRRRHPNT